MTTSVPGATVGLGVSGTVVLATGASVLYAVYALYSPLLGNITSVGCLVKGENYLRLFLLKNENTNDMYHKTRYCQLFCVNLIKRQIGPHLSYRI